MFKVRTHNGVITVRSRKTGEHRTLRIKTQAKDSKFAPGERIAELLVGPDNTSDYKGFAFVGKDGRVHLWRKNQDSEFFQWCRDFLQNPQRFVENAEVNFEGKCRMCNRALTTPESVESGIGPVCAGK